MLVCLLLCLLGSPFVFGYSIRGPFDEVALEDIFRELNEIPGQNDKTIPPDDKVHPDYQDKEDDDDDDDDDDDENELKCFDLKPTVLKHYIGFPDISKMSDEVENLEDSINPIINEALSIFELTSDARMAAKQMMVSLVEKTLNTTANCPSTLFNRIIMYAVGRSFPIVLRLENDSFMAIVNVLKKHDVSREDVVFYARKMFGNLTNDLMDDVLFRLSEKSDRYIKKIYPTIVKLIDEGKLKEKIRFYIRKEGEAAGLDLKCLHADKLMGIFSDVKRDFEERYEDFNDLLKILPLSHFDYEVKVQVENSAKRILKRGYQTAKRILSGLRDERTGALDKKERLLNEGQLAAFKHVVKRLNWEDRKIDEEVNVPHHDFVNIVVKGEMKDFEAINELFRNMKAILKMNFTVPVTGLDPRTAMWQNLKLFLERKCNVYKKYFIQYGKEIPECNRFK